MAEQLSQVHSDSMVNVLDKYVCDNLPEAPLRMACHSLVFELAPYLVDEVYKHESPDTVCHQVATARRRYGVLWMQNVAKKIKILLKILQ